MIILVYVAMSFFGRWIWESDPGLLSLTAFVACSTPLFAWFYDRHVVEGKNYWVVLSLVGWLSNALAMYVNGGFMPVLNGGDDYLDDVWIPMTDQTNLWLLCDIIYGGSIGDIMLLLGMVFSFTTHFSKETV